MWVVMTGCIVLHPFSGVCMCVGGGDVVAVCLCVWASYLATDGLLINFPQHFSLSVRF